MEPIVTQNLYLRQLTVEDITQAYVDALNDPKVVRLTEAKHFKWNRESVIEYVEKSNVEGESLLLGIFVKGSNKHIGNIRLFNFSKQHHRVELGIMIFDKSQWNKGYGTEALIAVTGYVFGVLELHRICADYYAVNAASARMFEKVGFKIEGVFRDHFFLDGEYVNSIRIARINE